MNRSKPTTEDLSRAWETLLGNYRPEVGGVIERRQLDDLFRALHADTGGVVDVKALDRAYDFLSALLGDQDIVLVMPADDENYRPRKARLTPPGAIERAFPPRRFAPFTSSLPTPTAKAAPTRPSLVPPSREQPSEPLRPLFGRYLLAEGYITLSELTAAILWQRAQRPPVGQIAVDWRILTREQVASILRQKTTAEMFCDHAVRVGLMSGFQRLAVLAKQRRLQKPIGAYFVERGILTQEQVDALARRVAA